MHPYEWVTMDPPEVASMLDDLAVRFGKMREQLQVMNQDDIPTALAAEMAVAMKEMAVDRKLMWAFLEGCVELRRRGTEEEKKAKGEEVRVKAEQLEEALNPQAIAVKMPRRSGALGKVEALIEEVTEAEKRVEAERRSVEALSERVAESSLE